MESAHASNEHTPLLEDFVAANEHRQLTSSPNPSSPLDGNASASNGYGAVNNLDEVHVDFSLPRKLNGEDDDLSPEEVGQALCSAWLRFRKKKRDFTLDFFSEKALYSMHLAWKKVTSKRQCNSEPRKIAAAIAAAIGEEMINIPCPSEDDSFSLIWHLEFYSDQNLIIANLLRNWQRITDGEGLPFRYTKTIFDDSDAEAHAVSKFRVKLVELYDKIHYLILNSRFQFLLHTLLFIWPISILVIGARFMDCPMGYHLSYLLLMLGSIGCLAVLVRLTLIHISYKTRWEEDFFFRWILQGFIEFGFLIIFVIQAFHFFDTDPATEPDPNKCVDKFYSTALWINYISIFLVSEYTFVYFVNIIVTQFDVSKWIFKLL